MSNDISEQASSAAAAQNNAHRHHKSGQSDAADRFSKMLDGFRANGLVEIDGGEGDDVIDAEGWAVKVMGGAGNDTITVFGHTVEVDGGSGDDTITVDSFAGHPGFPSHFAGQHTHHCGPGFNHPGAFDFPNETAMKWAGYYGYGDGHGHLLSGLGSRTTGGDGNDTINVDGFSWATGDAGNDEIHIGGGRAYGGTGDDTISNSTGSAQLFGGAGNDTITSTGKININTQIIAGAGDDTVYSSGTHMDIMGGTGNDAITFDGSDDIGMIHLDPHTGKVSPISARSRINGGQGDDQLTLTNDAHVVMDYFSGDGHDTIAGANESSTLRLGEGLTFAGTTFVVDGDNLAISFPDTEGSVTILDYASKGVPLIEFASGRTLDASTTITLAGGNANAYHADDRDGASKSSETSAHDD